MIGLLEAIENIFDKLPYAKLKEMDDKARWGIVAGVPVAVIALVYFLFITNVKGETATLSAEAATLKQENIASRKVEKALPALALKFEEIEKELNAVTVQLPLEKEIPDLLDQISNLGIQGGLEFLSFKPLDESQKDFYAEVPVRLDIIGPYHSVVGFFDNVSRMSRIITIANLTVIPYSGSAGKAFSGPIVQARCKAVTYRFIESRVDEAPEKKKK